MPEREERYKWQRGWIAPEGRLSFVDEAWLPEQSSPFYPADPSVVTLADLAEHRCLMFLGETGSRYIPLSTFRTLRAKVLSSRLGVPEVSDYPESLACVPAGSMTSSPRARSSVGTPMRLHLQHGFT